MKLNRIDNDPLTVEPTSLKNDPKDTFLLAHLTFFLQGIALYLAWDMFFSAKEFFLFRFATSVFVANYSNYFSFVFMATNLAFVVLATLRQQKANFPRQLLLSSIANLMIFIGLVVVAALPDISASVSFYITLALCCSGGIICAYMQNSCFAIASRWDSSYMRALYSGQGFSGIVSALIPFTISLFVSPESRKSPSDINHRGVIVFSLCSFVILIALILFLRLRKSSIYQHHMNSGVVKSSVIDNIEAKPQIEKRPEKGEILQVARKTGLLQLAQGMVWFVSMCVFPALSGNVTSTIGIGQFSGILRNPVIFSGFHYLVFNVSDWFGKNLAGFKCFSITNQKLLALLATSRSIFIVLFMMCNVERPWGEEPTIPTHLHSDTIFFALLIIFAFTNGFLSATVFIAAPQYVGGRPELEEAAGVAQSFATSLGCTLGSLVSFGIRGIVCRCNPFLS